MTLEFSLREHRSNATFAPDFTFTKETATIIRQTTTNPSIGSGYIFVVIPRAWLNGKYIRWNWNGWGSYSADVFRVNIYDGAYDRTSDVDFPQGASKLIKGNGLLQTLDINTGSFNAETKDVQIDVSGGSEDLCTLFFQLGDSWDGQNFWEQVDWVEINGGAGGADNLYDEQFTDSITMERTGTTGDYGYISTGTIVITTYHVSGVTKDGGGDVLVSCTVWLFKTSDKSYIDSTTSHASTGAYSFTGLGYQGPYFLRSHKDGSPNVFGRTDDDIMGVEE